ncbi:MAG: hypothetical protein K2J64_09915 [Desulfovibrio sp.]|nr:hypothetical protein [Desulfovibrio sp.]
MRSECAALLEAAIAASSVTAVARRLGVARSSLSLLRNGHYPGSTARMERRIVAVLGAGCPVYGGHLTAQTCRTRRGSPMPTSNPYALRRWRECQQCQQYREKEEQL